MIQPGIRRFGLRSAAVVAKLQPVADDREMDVSGWLLDEVAYAGRENRDPAHARSYDAKEDADAEREVALLKHWGLDHTTHVVDLGAGTGQFTMRVAAECERVVAVDVSNVMLDVLRARLTSSGHDNVEVTQAGFLTYEHTGRPADVVYSRYALHHLPDFWKVVALDRIRRFVAPGGILRLWDVVFNFAPADAAAGVEAWCAGFDNAIAGSWGRADVEEHVRDEHSTFTWLLEPMIERVGFAIEAAAYSADGVFARYVARAV